MNVAIIIATKNRPSDVRRVLESLSKQSYPIAEMVIVDSSNDNLTTDVVDKYSHNISGLLYIHSLPGLPFQRNLGISKLRSTPQIICFFDDDIELDRSYIATVVKKIESDLSIVGICGNAINEKRRKFLDRVIRKLFLITDNTTGKLLPSGDAGHIYAPEMDTEVDVLSGCNMIYRSNIFIEYNLRYDEALNDYAYMEDQDFSFRASKYGRLVQISNANIVHHVTEISRPKQKKLIEMYIIHSYYLFKKNLSPSTINYICYAWRIIGKLFDASAKSIRYASWGPLAGWLIGIMNINKLTKRTS